MQFTVRLRAGILMMQIFILFFCRLKFAVMVKAYEGALILADVCLLIVKMLFWLLESIYRTIVPPEEINVAGEIVLVH